MDSILPGVTPTKVFKKAVSSSPLDRECEDEIGGGVGGASSDDDETAQFLRALDRRSRLPRTIDLSLRPPLPLINFKGVGVRSEEVKTITGLPIRPIISNLCGGGDGGGGDLLQDISYTRKLIKWFAARSNKEVAVRQPKAYLRLVAVEDSELNCLDDHLVYKSTHFDGDGETDSGPTSARNDADGGDDPHPQPDTETNLEFDSKFESGNLFKAVRVTGREKLVPSARTLEGLHASPGGFAPPRMVDHEYDLTLRNDLNTNGNIQW